MATLPQLTELDRLGALGAPHLRTRLLCESGGAGERFPVRAYLLGSDRPDVPVVGFFGGVHGLERIGSEAVIAYLRSLVMRLDWDETLHQQLQAVKLVFMPLVNPGGVHAGTRANPNGVDLMRNSPVEALDRVPLLIGGQRLSAALPWYRGAPGAPMEVESAALCALVGSELLTHRFSMVVDCHSGFGLRDRLWFPYAHTTQPIARLAEFHALSALMDHSLVHHRYVMEPQSRQYITHGDLWDHLVLQAADVPGTIFMPLTLEMGSWLWVKKNPRQLFSRHGIFNPVIEHRQQRVLRQHMAWFDFITRVAASCRRWLPEGEARDLHHRRALARWYGRRSG